MFKFLETFIEIICWIQIAISPTLIGAIIGTIVYLKYRNNYGILGGSSITLIGLVIGIIWATRIWKKSGTLNFMSRINASPELDQKDLKNNK